MTRPRKPSTEERRIWLSKERRIMNKVFKRLQQKDRSKLAEYKTEIETINDVFLTER